MKRVLIAALALGAVGAFWLLSSGSGSTSSTPTYWVTLDNAFGLVEGADVKVAGVRAGKIASFRLDRNSYRALVGIEVTQKGFDQFRSDAFCESRPQSLIGEYFLDCQPGANGTPLKSGAQIPVSNTASTVAPDLVNNVLRLPYRERLRIIINELGAGVAGNATNLNQALRRAVPALRDTDRVLAILAQENQTIADLVSNGDAVITPLARNHAQVGRWVQMAGRTATTSADRRVALAQTFHKLPAFLAQLKPNMKALGDVAASQTPAFRNLDASAPQLTRFFNNLGPFADASRPAFRSLGRASVTGKQALDAAGPTISELNRFSAQAPEVGKNLAIILQHLDDPAYAVETDQRAAAQHPDKRPNYTGLEAFMQFVFDSSQAINIFDATHNILKINLIADPACVPYHDAAEVNAGGEALRQHCSANVIGPSSPGLYGQPDICDTGKCLARNSSTTTARRRSTGAGRSSPTTSSAGGGPNGGSGSNGSKPSSLSLPGLLSLLPGVPKLPAGVNVPGGVPRVPGGLPGGSGASSNSSSSSGASSVLNYLLGP